MSTIRRFFFQTFDPRDGTGTLDPGAAGSATVADDDGGEGVPASNDIAEAGQSFMQELGDDTSWDALIGDDGQDTPGPDAGEPDPAESGDQPRDPETGKFLPKDGKDAPTKDAEPEAGADDAPAPDAVADDPELTVALPGIKDRGEEDIELAAPDKATADRLRRLVNDGMRGAAFRARESALTEREESIADTVAEIEAGPVSWVLSHCTPERQIELGKAIMLEHYEAIAAEVDALADREKLLERKIDVGKQLDTEKTARSNAIAKRRYSTAMLKAAVALVPDGTDPDTEQRFLRDAERDLVDAIRAGRTLRPEDVERELGFRRSQYFPAPPKAGPAAASGAGAPSPVSDRAREIADAAKAKEGQDAIRRKIQLRKAATRPGTPGIGATPARRPVVSADATIEEATRELRKRGAPSTWD